MLSRVYSLVDKVKNVLLPLCCQIGANALSWLTLLWLRLYKHSKLAISPFKVIKYFR